jgi:predicted DsbA family dithiol-disulfide isomerase
VSSSLERLTAAHDIDLHWRSFELRPAGAPLPPGYRERILAARPRFEQMAREHYGLDIHSGPFGINSRPALIGAKFAEAKGKDKAEAYHRRVFETYWQEGRSIEDLDVLKAIAEEVGLEPQEFEAALKSPQFDADVSADIEQAYRYGLNGVPALVFETSYLVSGAQPYEVLAQVVEDIEAEQEK